MQKNTNQFTQLMDRLLARENAGYSLIGVVIGGALVALLGGPHDLGVGGTVAALGGLVVLQALFVQACYSARSSPKYRLQKIGLIAAVSILVLFIPWVLRYLGSATTYTTGVGEQKTVQLKDGSLLIINTDSRLQVKFTNDLRQISLIRGEVFLTSAHDDHRPLRLFAGDFVVNDIGTIFDVRVRNEGQVVVSVSEGRVTLKSSQVSTADESSHEITLQAGYIAASRGSQIDVRQVDKTQLEAHTIWTQGKLWFAGNTVEEVAAEFNRYNRTKLVIDDPALKRQKIGGVYTATDPESLISALRSLFPGVTEQRTDSEIRIEGAKGG